MEELFELINAFNRLNDKVDALHRKMDLLMKAPYKDLTLDSAAVEKLLNISPRTLYDLRARGLLPYHRLNRKVVFLASDVLAYLRKQLTIDN